jgi:hypothetical protein
MFNVEANGIGGLFDAGGSDDEGDTNALPDLIGVSGKDKVWKLQ